MTKLSQIAAESERLIGRMNEARRQALQRDLVELCEARWKELRGAEPTTPLAHALWSTMPPLADLFADLYTAGDARLDDVLQGHRPGWGMALLALAEIGRGDAEGARLAHEPMMVFETERAGAQLAASMAALLHGRWQAAPRNKHGQKTPLSKALALIVLHIKRSDLKAAVETIGMLADMATSDAALKELRHALEEVGIRFTGMADDHVLYTQHGHEHKPATIHQVGDTLIEIRQALLA